MAQKQLPSQADVWDDSELLDSWNEAVEEYKKYHSLAAKGERVNLSTSQLDDSTATGRPGPAVMTSAAETLPSATAVPDAEDQIAANTQPIASSAAPVPPQVLLATGALPIPIMVELYNTKFETVQDEDLKNLMMSWYYAGYYTGLYEGKQQGYARALEREGDRG